MKSPRSTLDARTYYDAFASRYEARRGPASAGGYHDLLDELEVDFVRRFGADGDVLEVGCGTGLLLQRVARFARTARGIDISPAMLAQARARGLDVQEAGAEALPFAAESFDVAYAFKVLAHVRAVREALTEMTRVVRPGGHVIAEFYNPWSLRAIVKRLAPAGRIAEGLNEDAVFTRYDSPLDVRALVPSGCRLVASRGVRVVLPVAALMDLRGVRKVVGPIERHLSDSPLRHFAGFWMAALEKVP